MRRIPLLLLLLATAASAKPATVEGYLRLDDLDRDYWKRIEALKERLAFLKKPREERMVLTWEKRATEFEGKRLSGKYVVDEIFEEWEAIQEGRPTEEQMKVLVEHLPRALKVHFPLKGIKRIDKRDRYNASRILVKHLDDKRLHMREAAIACLSQMYGVTLFYKPNAPRDKLRDWQDDWEKYIKKMAR